MSRPGEKPPAEPAGSAATDLENVNREYPYDSRLLIYEQTGINKLKAMPDRELAAQLYRNWKRVEERMKPREMYPAAATPAPAPAPTQTNEDHEQEWWEK